MGTQLRINNAALKAAGFTQHSCDEEYWSEVMQTEQVRTHHWWEGPSDEVIGSYSPTDLLVDWNPWGMNIECLTPIFEKYSLLADADYC